MNQFYNFGISEKEIVNMINICNEIKNLKENEITNKILILQKLGCSNRHIRNILISNPFYLIRFDSDIVKLINKLISLGFECLNILFDTNPYILNKDSYEIDNYIKYKLKQGYLKEDIIDELESDPFIFETI